MIPTPTPLNYFVATLGMREIQLVKTRFADNGFVVSPDGRLVLKTDDPSLCVRIRPTSDEYPDTYSLSSPREDGKRIYDNWEAFRPIIDWPIIRPALTYLKEKHVPVDIIMLIYTDQEHEYEAGQAKEFHVKNDTLHFKDCIEKLIREEAYFDHTQIDLFVCEKEVTSITCQYEQFMSIDSVLLYPDRVNKVYLFPQGGIDSINQAITLRLIEAFQESVVQLQLAEGQAIQELDFPARFLANSRKKQVAKLLKAFQYDAVLALVTHETAKQLCRIGIALQGGSYTAMQAILATIPVDDEVTSLVSTLKAETDFSFKLKYAYLNAKIQLSRQQIQDYIWRLAGLQENFCKEMAEAVLGEPIPWTPYNGHQAFNDAIHRISGLSVFIGKNIPANWKKPYQPNRVLYYQIARFGKKISTDTGQVYHTLEEYVEHRHNTVHLLMGVTRDELEELIEDKKMRKTELLIKQLDRYFQLPIAEPDSLGSFGLFEVLNKRIEATFE